VGATRKQTGLSLTLGNPGTGFTAKTTNESDDGVPTPWPACAAQETLGASELYGRLRFFHGPAFQIPGEISLASGTAWCLAPVTPSALSEREGPLALPMDFAFQLVAWLGVHFHDTYSLPAGVKKFWRARELGGVRTLRIAAQLSPGAPDGMLAAHAQITDAQSGRVLATLEGITHHIQRTSHPARST